MNTELQHISENIFFIPDATNIGVICDKKADTTDIYLVDCGYSPDRGKIIIDILDNAFPSEGGRKAYIVKAVICTHTHADHICACAYLEEKTGCEIWCTQAERGNLELPMYEQSIVSGGYPLPELQTPFYQAQPVYDAKLIRDGQVLHLSDGTEISFIALPGHHFEMIGVLVKTTADKTVFFSADAIFGRQRMKKYWIPFLMDVGGFKISLRKIVSLNADFVLPSHGELVQGSEIEALAELNRYAVLSTEKSIISILKEPHTQEELLKAVADENNIPLGLAQFYLIGCTIKSYISYLYRSGKIRFYMKDNRMIWQTI